jgi:hypothetical protein
MLVGLGHQLRLGRVCLCCALAVMDRHNDGSRLGEGLRDIGVHAHFGRAGIETGDLLQLATANRGSSRKRRESCQKLHLVRVSVCVMGGKRLCACVDEAFKLYLERPRMSITNGYMNQFRCSATHALSCVACLS